MCHCFLPFVFCFGLVWFGLGFLRQGLYATQVGLELAVEPELTWSSWPCPCLNSHIWGYRQVPQHLVLQLVSLNKPRAI